MKLEYPQCFYRTSTDGRRYLCWFCDIFCLFFIVATMGLTAEYSYEDYPDGTNCLYKTACITRYTAGFGKIDILDNFPINLFSESSV